ncbi:Pantothenate synthetase [bioreactor metagenome]|uniref:pantoate--beta-alanine ligase (AMP-forming) n=1 Tax=bioreactor metagenome TaxID=1076179 RepID=A0A644UDH1_9ZZZZ|nr:pantoate--beta-alanine ligase [Negativicutes bacterium]
MKIISRVEELRALIHELKLQGKSVGLVPTMGYLHEGHLSLIREAKAQQDVVVASIFVNPLQFGANEDFAVYPRDLERDSQLAADAGLDIIFAPSVEEMYPQGFENMITFVDLIHITDKLCGAARPGHFRGVATVVTKLFNLVCPDAAYFGQKDAQQVIVIKRMVVDLNMNINIVTVPIVREADGLAMSSRNVYLSPEQRQAALVLNQSLRKAAALLDNGERDCTKLKQAIEQMIGAEPLADIEYIAICDTSTLENLAKIENKALIALAVKFGNTRLIDNIIWEG